jgi:phosphohistidine phosphatase SixA
LVAEHGELALVATIARAQVGNGLPLDGLVEPELRAARLAVMFGDVEKLGRVQRIYVTNTRRSQQTAANLAQRLNIEPTIVDSKVSNAELAREVLRDNKGGRAIVIGHSNTVPDLVQLFGGAKPAPLSDDAYGTIYDVEPGGMVVTTPLR